MNPIAHAMAPVGSISRDPPMQDLGRNLTLNQVQERIKSMEIHTFFRMTNGGSNDIMTFNCNELSNFLRIYEDRKFSIIRIKNIMGVRVL